MSQAPTSLPMWSQQPTQPGQAQGVGGPPPLQQPPGMAAQVSILFILLLPRYHRCRCPCDCPSAQGVQFNTLWLELYMLASTLL